MLVIIMMTWVLNMKILSWESSDNTDKAVSGASDTLETTTVTLNATADKLLQEQLDDQTLNGCRALCNRDKGRFFLKNGIMYPHTKIIGRPVEQLVVHQLRRAEVLKLAHDTFGAHQSALNTAYRIQYSMWFPSLMKACKQYTMSCEVCCRRSRETCYDRVPIKPIERDDVSSITGCVMRRDPFGLIKTNRTIIVLSRVTVRLDGQRHLLCVLSMLKQFVIVY
jgi:Integrase zinc binding domain